MPALPGPEGSIQPLGQDISSCTCFFAIFMAYLFRSLNHLTSSPNFRVC
jgi:hypothetical protein